MSDVIKPRLYALSIYCLAIEYEVTNLLGQKPLTTEETMDILREVTSLVEQGNADDALALARTRVRELLVSR